MKELHDDGENMAPWIVRDEGPRGMKVSECTSFLSEYKQSIGKRMGITWFNLDYIKYRYSSKIIPILFHYLDILSISAKFHNGLQIHQVSDEYLIKKTVTVEPDPNLT